MFTQLPRFEANQVLSNKHLNQIIEFLEEQGRLTRNALHGYGIVAGLELRRDNNNAISISEGAAVSSYGYLMMPDTTNSQADSRGRRVIAYNKKKVYKPQNLLFPYKLGNDTTVANYDFFEGLGDIIQLVPSSEPNNADALISALQATDLNNRVVVLFLQIQVKELQSCEADSCMELGKQWNYAVIPLLLTNTQADAIIQKENNFNPAPAPGTDLDPLLKPAYHLPDIPLARPDLGAIAENSPVSDLANMYKDAMRALLTELAETKYNRIDESLRLILKENFISSPVADFKTKLTQLLNVTNAVSRQEYFQYAYSFAKDITEAYRELQDAVFDYASFEIPADASFPHHIRLGKVPELNGLVSSHQYPPNTYRHGFTGSRIQDNQREAYHRVVTMYQRMVTMIQSLFTALRVNDIRITPSVETGRGLGRRAIPFYYAPNQTEGRPVVASAWNPAWSRMAKTNRLLNYYDNANTVNRAQFLAGKNVSGDEQLYLPLLYRHDDQDFYRIEGHVSAPYTDVFKTLSEYIQNYHLPFDLQLVRLNKEAVMLIRDKRILFDDLESLYNVVREEIGSLLNTEFNYFSNIRLTKRTNTRPRIVINQAAEEAAKTADVNPVENKRRIPTPEFDEAKFYRSMSPKVSGAQFFKAETQTAKIDLGVQDSILSLYNKFEGKVAIQDVVGIIGGAGGINIAGLKSTPAAPFVSKMIAAISAVQNVLAVPFDNFKIAEYEQRIKALENETKSFILYAKSQTDASLREDSNITKGEALDYLDRIFYEPDFEKIGALAEERKRREEQVGVNNYLQQFIARNPGVEHRGGVWKNGTFVVVFNENGVVVGDFCLPYRCSSGSGATQYVLGVLKTILFAGQVLDTNGAPVKKATVTVNEEPLLLDESSSFKKAVPPNSFLLVKANADGFEPKELQITAQSEDILQNIVLFTKAQELKVNLALSVTDANNKPVQGATALLNEEKLTLDGNGTFKGPIKAGANFVLTVTATGFKPFTEVFATLDKDITIKATLARIVKFSGTILDPSQKPVLNAKVLINGQLLPVKENRFETELESKVSYNFVIEAENLEKFAETITPADADINRVFQLTKIASLNVRVGVYVASKVVFNPRLDRLRRETIFNPGGGLLRAARPRIDILRDRGGGIIAGDTDIRATETNDYEFLGTGLTSTVDTKAQFFNTDLKVFSSEELKGQHKLLVSATAVNLKFSGLLAVSDMDVMVLIPARQNYRSDGIFSVVVRSDSGPDNMKLLNAFFVKQFSTPNVPWFNRTIDFRFFTASDAEDFASRLKTANIKFLTLRLG